ncbi:radical SAM protein [candidate division KSB1 bacterium]|nr:radical SAM protein [candidate division KSB1 bacterium]
MSKTTSKYVRKSRLFSVLKDKNFLRQLDIELTERCNNRCIHCYINRPQNDRKAAAAEMSTKKVLDIIDEAAALGCLRIRLTGGEPLLRDDFEDIYVHTRRHGIKVVLFTNATLLTPKRAQLLAQIPPLEPVEVSMYGRHRQSYEEVTLTEGSYQAAEKGLRLLEENGIPYVVRTSLLPPNKSEWEEFATGTDEKNNQRPLNIFYNLRARRDNPAKNKRIQKLRYTPQEIVRLKKASFDDDQFKQRLLAAISGPPGEKIFVCSAGENSGCVDAYGRLQMCTLLRHPDFVYDLNEYTLKQGLSFFVQKRMQKANNRDYMQRCARCFIRRLCEMCPARAWMEHGVVDRPVEYYCRVAHAEARYLGLLDDNEWAWQVDNWKKRINLVLQKKQAVGG